MALTIKRISELEELFTKKNWEIVKQSHLFSSTFNRYCARMEMFDEDKQNLLLELGYNFIDLGLNDFQPRFIDAIKKIPHLEKYASIIVAPLKKPSLNETKSADGIWYHLKSYSDFSYETFGKKLFFLSDWKSITKSMCNPNHLLILIDDFIGTGETVVEALDELYTTGCILVDQSVKVLTFMAQAAGVQAVEKKYPDIVVCSIGLNKGLSDNYVGSDLINRKNHMIEMEKKLNVKAEYEFGYGKSESLVAVSQRSANNTFPVFWLEKKNKLAPFKR